MGFDGVVVTDALGMGGFMGWYKSARQAQIESFKAGCDMMLWPTAEYVDDMIEAVENGYISMERLDDAVGRILQMKEKIGLFKKDNHAVLLTPQEREFVANTQKRTAEASITLLRDESSLFPLSPEKQKKIAVIPTTHFEPSLKEGELLCEELNKRGFAADFIRNPTARQWKELAESHDVLMFAVFSRPFRPIGFLDFMGDEAAKVADCGKYGVDKTVVVSFGSPYFAEQYFERIPTCVNAYSMLSPSVKAFVRAATGEIPFSTFSPVELQD
jgi:beta-N-acetylhexosaminidase